MPAPRRSPCSPDGTDTEVASAKAVIEAFQAANPNITIKHDTRPGGSEGDNLVKTRLATGDMADVFIYNNGSLLQAIKPEQNLTPLDDQPWAGQLDELFADSSKADGKLYGGPYGTAFGGGVLYNIPRLREAGSGDPEDVGRVHGQQREDQGADGSADPVEQTYGDDLDLPAVRARRLRQRRGGGARLRRGLHRQQGQVRHHTGGVGRLPAHPGRQGRRLLQQGLRLGQAERRDEGSRHRQRCALSAARRHREQHRERRAG